MKIGEARGTALDHFYHPRAEKIKERLVQGLEPPDFLVVGLGYWLGGMG